MSGRFLSQESWDAYKFLAVDDFSGNGEIQLISSAGDGFFLSLGLFLLMVFLVVQSGSFLLEKS